MSEQTAISWTDHTFNTHWGCSKISPGCNGCYAEKLAARFGYGWGDDAPKREFAESHWDELIVWDRKAKKAGMRRRVFTNSMSDLFDKFAPAGVRERHFEYIKRTPNLDHLLLTKRIGNVRSMLPADWGDGYPNAWLGATVVNQEEADRDIHKLLATPARLRFLSIEPMLGNIRLGMWLQLSPSAAFQMGRITADMPDWTRIGSTAINWVIAGGESGPHARPAHPDWFRSLRDQCAAAGVQFHFKQHGEWIGVPDLRELPGGGGPGFGRFDHCKYDMEHEAVRVGKATAGRLLDGIEHNGFPA